MQNAASQMASILLLVVCCFFGPTQTRRGCDVNWTATGSDLTVDTEDIQYINTWIDALNRNLEAHMTFRYYPELHNMCVCVSLQVV